MASDRAGRRDLLRDEPFDLRFALAMCLLLGKWNKSRQREAALSLPFRTFDLRLGRSRGIRIVRIPRRLLARVGIPDELVVVVRIADAIRVVTMLVASTARLGRRSTAGLCLDDVLRCAVRKRASILGRSWSFHLDPLIKCGAEPEAARSWVCARDSRKKRSRKLSAAVRDACRRTPTRLHHGLA